MANKPSVNKIPPKKLQPWKPPLEAGSAGFFMTNLLSLHLSLWQWQIIVFSIESYSHFPSGIWGFLLVQPRVIF